MIIQPDEDEYMSMHSFRSVKDISDIPKMKLQEEENICHVLEETKISLYSNIDLYSNLDSEYDILYFVSLFCSRFIPFKQKRSYLCVRVLNSKYVSIEMFGTSCQENKPGKHLGVKFNIDIRFLCVVGIFDTCVYY